MPTDEQANFARIKGGATKLPDLRIFQSLQIGAHIAVGQAAWAGTIALHVLAGIAPDLFTQFRTQNRCALLLELL
ncbi:hypothetical protein [Aerobium aerolatum]|uniref:hypothetical protein n=1 Tax=Aerobium aerolatum TaxID=561088 RepID=UPI000B899E31|nr:hypothetical protein [Aquamicrobium aerolatum]